MKRVDHHLVTKLFNEEPFESKKIIVNVTTMECGLGLAYKWKHNQWLKLSFGHIMKMISLEERNISEEPRWILDISFNPSGEIILFKNAADEELNALKDEDFERFIVWIAPVEPLTGYAIAPSGLGLKAMQ